MNERCPVCFASECACNADDAIRHAIEKNPRLTSGDFVAAGLEMLRHGKNDALHKLAIATAEIKKLNEQMRAIERRTYSDAAGIVADNKPSYSVGNVHDVLRRITDALLHAANNPTDSSKWTELFICWEIMERLRQEEGASIALICTNPEPTGRDDQEGVEYCAECTGWDSRTFYADTVLHALAKAETYKTQFYASKNKN